MNKINQARTCRVGGVGGRTHDDCAGGAQINPGPGLSDYDEARSKPPSAKLS